MATELAVVDAPLQREIDSLTFVATDAAAGNAFRNDGNTVVVVRNPTAGALTLTVVSIADRRGRTGDLTVTVPAGAIGFVPFLDPEYFNQRSGVDEGKVRMTYSAAGLTLAILRLRAAR